LANARSQLSQVLKTSPEDPNAWNLMGVIDAQEGRYRAAEAEFQKAIAAAPNFAGAYLNLGRLYQENAGKDPEALKKGVAIYDRLVKLDPANVEAAYQSAFLLWRLGAFQTSLERLGHLPQAAQERPQSLAVRCGDYAGVKNLRAAQDAAERLLRHPDLTEADILPLLPVLVAEHHEELATSLTEGLDNRRLASAETLHQLAGLYEQSGKLQQARATLERVAQLQSISVPLLIEMARVANQQGDHEGTLGYLAHARDLEPNNAGVHFFFGMVCVEMNLVEEARLSLAKAVDLNPDHPYYNYALGSVLMGRQNVREAFPYLKKYCELKPDDPRGRLALGAAYFYGHEPQLARQELEGVVKYPATAAPAHYFLGRLDNQDGNFDAAMRELHKALEGIPRYAEAYAEMGLIQLKQKNYPEAEANLRKALEISPESYPANLNLMILYQRTKDPRADAQAKRFEEIKKLRAERENEFLRTIEVRP